MTKVNTRSRPSHQSSPKFALLVAVARELAIRSHSALGRTLMMCFRRKHRAIEGLLRRWHVESGVLVEKVDWLQRYLDRLHRHHLCVIKSVTRSGNLCKTLLYRKVFDSGDVIDAKLDPHNNVLVLDIVLAIRPAPYPRSSTRLVRKFTTGIELIVAMGRDEDGVTRKLGALMVEALLVRQHLLEGGRMYLVSHRPVIDWIPNGNVLDLEGASLFKVDVESTRLFNDRLLDVITHAVWVQLWISFHCVGFVIDKSILMAIQRRIDSKREDVLVMHSQHARVNNGAPRNFNAIINGLSTQDAGGPHFVRHLAGLVEHESQDVLVVGHGDDALHNKLSVSDDDRSAGPIVGMFEPNASILLVHANGILQFKRLALLVGDETVDVVNRAEAVTTKFEVVCHDACTRVSKVKGRLLVEWMSRVSVGYVHVRQGHPVEEASIVVTDLSSPSADYQLW